MEDRDARFLEELWKIQEEMQLSNAQMAEFLGVDRTLLDHTRKGRRDVAKTLLVAGCDRLPRLREIYFAQDVPFDTDIGANQHTEAVA